MPAIPNVPGVPALVSYAVSLATVLVADVLRFFGISVNPVWGVFLNGFNVINPDSVVSFELKQDFSVSDYPVEQGGFQSYNKVQLPTDIRLRMACGGDEATLQDFLASVEAVMNTVDLYDIITPEGVYVGYNFTHRDFRRTAQNGVGLIVVDLWLTEVRVTVTATFTNTQQPGVAGQQGVGAVQAREPSDSFTQGFPPIRFLN